MNICCGSDMRAEEPKEEEVKVKVEEGVLNFDFKKGVFKYMDIKKINEKKQEMENLEKELEEKENEKNDYKERIKDLDLKLKNLEKILMMDMKEKQYITIIGKKTEENRNDD